MITATGCKDNLIITGKDWGWYPIYVEHPGPDEIAEAALICGDKTRANKYIRLCDDCARKEGLKW